MHFPGQRSACVLFICGAESQFLSAQNPRGAWPLCAKWDESFQHEPEWRGSKAPSQNPCLKFLHGLLQEPLPSKKMDFKGDVCGQQLGSSKTLPRTLSSPPQLESLGGDTQTGLIKESEMRSGSSMTSSQSGFSLGSMLVSIPSRLAPLRQAREPEDLVCRKKCCVLHIVIVIVIHMSQKQRGAL